ncbi:Broad specificity phosphatase PhoE [Mariprofundus ferrinatatus]|uniref:Broad specificity phosphatase PhoE n=1 Tax=Mariprofundus ferrinatatus TaxID=1921087 RepID=A0A2K8LAC0_9PROT|nr:histidine phosphatase family protein [Mariprofundus ferrinatatus]ATX81206.1 Broad specificity phosphatase PhoE [Mariprofundus ferrinatatus]
MLRIASILIATATALSAFFVTPASSEEFKPLNIYYVRHGETLGNVTHKHGDYYDRTFSEEGARQVAELTAKLDEIEFDHIVTSPKYRAMNTIFPYLKKHNLKADIWPELAECCWQKERGDKATRIGRDDHIEVEPGMQPYFTFAEKTDSREFKARNYGDGLLMVSLAYERLLKNYSGSGKTILVVGHYHSGGRLIEMLQGYYPEGNYQLWNARITQLQEQEDGSFSLIASNY